MGSQRESRGLPYVLAWLALAVLTAGSYGLAQLHLGAFAPVLALAIAGVKAGIVLLVFMHLSHARLSIALVGLINLLWITLLCLGVAADVLFR